MVSRFVAPGAGALLGVVHGGSGHVIELGQRAQLRRALFTGAATAG